MKARNYRRILIAISMFASFIICLCVSIADITPFFLMTGLVFTSLALDKLINRGFTAVKLFTQKAE